MSLSCATPQLTKENATHWAKGKNANNIRQCSFFHLLSLHKEKYVYTLLSSVPVCATFPANNALKKRGSPNKCSFPYKASTSTKQIVVIYKLVVAFELVFVWRLGSFQKQYVLSTMCNYCVLKCSIPVFFLYPGNIPSGRCCFLQRLNI